MIWDVENDGPEPTQEQSDRLELFLRCGMPSVQVGPIAVTAASLGTEDEWAHTAIGYLKCMQACAVGDETISAVAVSAAALSCALGYIERLEIGAGIILSPGTSAGGAL